jgi:hypothetical protein
MMRIEERMLSPLRLAGACPSGIAGATWGDTIFPGELPVEFPVDKYGLLGDWAG